VDILEDPSATTAKKNSSRKELKKNIINSMMLFDGSEYFRGEEFSVLDATIIPILIRLKFLGVDIPNNKSTKNMHEYLERMIENELIQDSLTLRERESFFTD
jgi:RNA polymerase-associated protein